MGLILNNNVEETKIMSAYGLTVYGKINRYIWTLEGNADAERQRMEETQQKERAAVDSITDYSNVNGLIPAFTYEKVYLIKALTEKVGNVLKTADNKQMEGILQFMESHPDNTDAKIVISGTMEEILQYIA